MAYLPYPWVAVLPVDVVVVPVSWSLCAQAPRLKATAASAMMLRVFMCNFFPSFLCQLAWAALIVSRAGKTTYFCRRPHFAPRADHGCMKTSVPTGTRS